MNCDRSDPRPVATLPTGVSVFSHRGLVRFSVFTSLIPPSGTRFPRAGGRKERKNDEPKAEGTRDERRVSRSLLTRRDRSLLTPFVRSALLRVRSSPPSHRVAFLTPFVTPGCAASGVSVVREREA